MLSLQSRRLFEILHAVLIAAALSYLFVAALPHENALSLAADGKLQLSTAWGYRFRHAGMLAAEGEPLVLIALMKLLGAKGLWSATLLAQSLILARSHRMLRSVFAGFAACSIVLAPSLLFWSAAGAGALVSRRALAAVWRSRNAVALGYKTRAWLCLSAVALSILGFVYGALWLANPLHHVNRQRVLGGKSYRDGILSAAPGRKLQWRENCLAVFNPDDLRAVSSLETISLNSLRELPALAIN